MDIYVANLSPETNEEDLKQLFSEFGEVLSARIMKDRETGMSRGFGFVEMADKFLALDAIDNIDCTYFQGQVISAKQAKAKAGGPGNNGGGNFNRPQRPTRPMRPRNRDNNGGGMDPFNKRW